MFSTTHLETRAVPLSKIQKGAMPGLCLGSCIIPKIIKGEVAWGTVPSWLFNQSPPTYKYCSPQT